MMVLHEIEEGGVPKTVPPFTHCAILFDAPMDCAKRERTFASAGGGVRIEFAGIAPSAVEIYTPEFGGEAGGA